jgi:hypothetical protein
MSWNTGDETDNYRGSVGIEISIPMSGYGSGSVGFQVGGVPRAGTVESGEGHKRGNTDEVRSSLCISSGELAESARKSEKIERFCNVRLGQARNPGWKAQ